MVIFMKVTLEQWRMLKAVVDHGGFAHAADAVHKSQSSINHAIHKMEGLLGVKLLEVKGRKAFLTDAGGLLLRRAERLLESASGIDALAASLQQGDEPEIALAIDQTFPADYITEVLVQFAQDYPNTRIQLHETVLSGAAEALIQGQVDLAIAGSGVSHFLAEPLFGIDFVAVASPAHPLIQSGDKVNIDDLINYRQLVTRDSARDQNIDSGWLEAEERWTVSNIATSVDMIRRGVGFAWLPVTRIQDLLQKGEMVPLPLENGGVRSMMLQLYYAEHDRCGPGVRHLAELLHRYAKDDSSNYTNVISDL